MLSFAGAFAAASAASADRLLKLDEGLFQSVLQGSCRRRSNTPVSRTSWLDDAHLDIACRELRRRLSCASIAILTPVLTEAWLQTKDEHLVNKISNAKHVKRVLIPVSDDVLQDGRGGSHWTLLVVEKKVSGAGHIHQLWLLLKIVLCFIKLLLFKPASHKPAKLTN
jgi:hypothetical protein